MGILSICQVLFSSPIYIKLWGDHVQTQKEKWSKTEGSIFVPIQTCSDWETRISIALGSLLFPGCLPASYMMQNHSEIVSCTCSESSFMFLTLREAAPTVPSTPSWALGQRLWLQAWLGTSALCRNESSAKDQEAFSWEYARVTNQLPTLGRGLTVYYLTFLKLKCARCENK